MGRNNLPILCVDFDGVVHMFTSPWVDDVTIADGPVPGALAWLWNATNYFDVRNYSSRSKTEAGRHAMYHWMVKHSIVEFGQDHPMSASPIATYPIMFAAEKPPAFLTIDDRALRFNGDWTEFDPAVLRAFKPWNRL